MNLVSMAIEYIREFFPGLTPAQLEQFETMMRLYPEWNERINVISRKDIGNLEVQHILHSLAILKFIRFAPGTEVIDIGTGGGFPGLPLAAAMPDVHFHLIVRIGKKLRVAEEVAKAAGIENVTFQHGDLGECRRKFDFAVSRAVMPQPDLMRIASRVIADNPQRNALPNGLITLKGGDLHGEIRPIATATEIVDIHKWLPLPFFDTKKIVYTSK